MTVVKDEHNKSFANSSGDESTTNGQQDQRPAAPITVSSQDAPPHPSPPLPPLPPAVPSQNAPVSLVCRIPYRKLKLVLKPSPQTLVTPPEESKTQSQSNSNEPQQPHQPQTPSPKSKTKRPSNSPRKSSSKSPVKFTCFCYYCDRKFSTVELRQKHLDQIHSNQPECKYCKKTIKRIQRLFDHYRRYHSDRFVGCFECFEQYETQSELESHNVHVGHTLPRQLPSQASARLSSSAGPAQATKQAASSAVVPAATVAVTTTAPASVVTRSSISESLNVRQNALPLIELEQLREAFGLPVRNISETAAADDAAEVASESAELVNKSDTLTSRDGEVAATAEETINADEKGRSNRDANGNGNEPHHLNLKKLLPLKCRAAIRDDASSEDGGQESEAKEPKDLSELDISTQLDVYDRYLSTKRTRVRNRRKPSASTLDGFAANLDLVRQLSNGKRTSTVAGSSQAAAATPPIGTKRLTGEKSLQKTYLCLVCGLLLDSYKVYVRHKEDEHSHIFSLNYELIGPELNQLKHVNFLGFNRSTKIETLEQRYESLTLENRLRSRQRRRESRNKKKKALARNGSDNDDPRDSSLVQKPLHKCTKCAKDGMETAELHQHILVCSGLYEWLPKANVTATAGSSTAASGSTLAPHSNSRKRRKTANTVAVSTNATASACSSVTTTSTMTAAPSKAKKRKSNDFENDLLPCPELVQRDGQQSGSDSDEDKPLASVFKSLKKSFLANGLSSRRTAASDPDSKEIEQSQPNASAADEPPKPETLKVPVLTLQLSDRKTQRDNDLVVEDKSIAANPRIVIKIKKQQAAMAVVVNDDIKREEEAENSDATTMSSTIPTCDAQVAVKPKKHKKKRKRKNAEIGPAEIVRVMDADAENGCGNDCKSVEDLITVNSKIEAEAETEAKVEAVAVAVTEVEQEAKQEPDPQIVNFNCCPVATDHLNPETVVLSVAQTDDDIKEEGEVLEKVEMVVPEIAPEEPKNDDVRVEEEEKEGHPDPRSENGSPIENITAADVKKPKKAETAPEVPESENKTELPLASPPTEIDTEETTVIQEPLPVVKSASKKSQSPASTTEFFCDICRKYYKKEDSLQKHKMTIRHISKLSEIEAAEHSRRLELEAAACKERERLRAVEEPSSDQKSPSAGIVIPVEATNHRRFSQPVRTGPVLLKIPTKGAMKLYADEEPHLLPPLPPPAPLLPSPQMQDEAPTTIINPKDQIMQRIFCKSFTKLSPLPSNDCPAAVFEAVNEPKAINDFNHNNHEDGDMEIEKAQEVASIETSVSRHERQQEQPLSFSIRQSLAACKTPTLDEAAATVEENLVKTAAPPKKIDFEQELRECIGVAGRKSQRKCTSGKQNVLVEQWSSDESLDEDVGRSSSWSAVPANGNGRATSGDESSEDDDCSAAGAGRNTHRKRKRRKQCTGASAGSGRATKKTTATKNAARQYRRRIMSLSLSASPPHAYQWPPASPPSLSSLPSNQRNLATAASTASLVPSLSSTAVTSSPSKPLFLSNSPAPLITFSNALTLNSSFPSPPLNTSTATTTTASATAAAVTKTNLAVKSASENGSGTEDESLQQHGWIVGDSARKLVTLLAHSKSRVI